MSNFGIFLFLEGIALVMYALSSSTSVSSGTDSIGTDRIVNLGLMNDQQNLVICGSALAIIGSIFIVGGTIDNKLVSSQSAIIANGTPARPIHDVEESKLTAEQRDLKAKYERSEISLEEYREAWNKLS